MTQHKNKIEIESQERFEKSFTIPSHVLPYCKKENINIIDKLDYIDIIVTK